MNCTAVYRQVYELFYNASSSSIQTGVSIMYCTAVYRQVCLYVLHSSIQISVWLFYNVLHSCVHAGAYLVYTFTTPNNKGNQEWIPWYPGSPLVAGRVPPNIIYIPRNFPFQDLILVNSWNKCTSMRMCVQSLLYYSCTPAWTQLMNTIVKSYNTYTNQILHANSS